MRLSVFYFDDDVSLLRMFEQMFGVEHDVRVASSLEEARASLRGCAADVIISDQVMPEIEGTEFLREAMGLCPGSVRVLVTGAVSFGVVFAEVAGGVVQFFVAKPWGMDQMGELLERASAMVARGD